MPSARGVPIPTSVVQPATLQCSLRIAPTTCDHRSCHTFCLKPESLPTAACPADPTTILQSSMSRPAICRTCHAVCGRGEHTSRHVLLASSADNHSANHHHPSHKAPLTTCLSQFLLIASRQERCQALRSPPAELASSYHPQERRRLLRPRSLRTSVHVSAKCPHVPAPAL